MRKLVRRGFCLGLLAGLVAVPASIPALAQDGSAATVLHRQSVLSQLSAIGELDTSRVFTQLTVAGDGPVEVVLEDQSTRRLRNLGGLGRPSTDGDSVIYGVDATPAGVHQRTVANNVRDLPVEIDVAYEFDGEPVEDPHDVVGRNGELTVTYTVRNLTAEPTEIDVLGGTGDITTETVDVGVPFVGTLALPLDERFGQVEARDANVASDGAGNTLLNWDLVLFEPLGSFEQTVSWSATVTDALVPAANVQLVPVTSDTYQVLPNSMSRFADTNAAVSTLTGTSGLGRVDMVVTALADGASELLDGMNQLADGSDELAAGLVRAADGSRDLADGTGQAASGSRDLADGTGQAASGSRDLADGTDRASDGSRELATGLGDLSDGAEQVADGNEAVNEGTQALSSGLGDLSDGAEQVADGTGQVSSGAAALAEGLLAGALPGSAQIRDGLNGLVAAFGVTSDEPADGTIIGGINGLLAGLSGDLAQGTDALKRLTEGLAEAFGPDPDAGGAHAGQKAQAAADGAGAIKDGATQIEGGAAQLAAGIGAIKAQTGAIPFASGDEHLDYDAIKGDWVCLDSGAVNSLGVPTKCVSQDVYDALAFAVGGEPNLPPDVAVDGSLLFTVDQHLTNLAGGAGSIGIGAGSIKAGATQLQSGLQAQADSLGDWPADCEAAITHVMTTADPDGLAVILAQSCIAAQVDGGLTGLIIPGMEKLQVGINNPACDPDDPTDPANPCGVKQVLDLLAGGSAQLASGLDDAATGAGALAEGASQLDDGANALHAGAGQAHDGSQELAAGTERLSDGARDLASGAGRAATGGRDLSDGLAEIAAGANRLSNGLGEIDDGAKQLSDGLGEIDDGANQLADGLGDARDGSGQLADGMGDARDGVVGIESNLGDMEEFDMPRAMGNLDRTGAEADRLLKQARASDERSKAGDGLPYGTADGAAATADYQFEIAGVGTDEGASTPVRVGAAVLAFGAATALGLGVRRRLI